MRVRQRNKQAQAEKRLGAKAALAVAINVLFCVTIVPAAFGQAVLNSNQIRGQVEFTNSNPAVLALLQGGEGLKYASVYADSIGVTPALNNNSWTMTSDPMAAAFEITVESGSPGIRYNVRARASLANGRKLYVFARQTSAPVEPEPAADTIVNFSECAGVLDVKWYDTNGNPFVVSGGNMKAFRNEADGRRIVQAYEYRINSDSSQEYMIVRGDGASYEVVITYTTGNDPFEDTVSARCEETVAVSCDEIVKIDCIIPPGGELGQIAGVIDMEGEDEHDVGSMTRIVAFNGPLGNMRFDKLAGSPASGAFLLPNLMPSSAEETPKGYIVYGEMVFRTGYRTQWMRTPWLYGSFNGGSVMVNAGETTELGDTFVMKPGFLTGNIFLTGPADGTGTPALATLFRDADRDRDGDGVPDNYYLYGSHVAASGSYQVLPGATTSAFGGYTRASFAGAFDASTQEFKGDYEMVLGGLKREGALWTPTGIKLAFRETSTPLDPDSYHNSTVHIRSSAVESIEIVPGETVSRDHAYCMSEVDLSFRSLSGNFYSPRVSGRGSFQGEDFRGIQADYTSWLGYSTGTPTTSATASDQGLVKMLLPQGSYTLTPNVMAINPGGGTSYTELRPVDIEVGCQQRLSVSTDLQMSVSSLDQCVDNSAITLAGALSGGGEVSSVSYVLNDAAEVTLCSGDCGVDPTFETSVEVEGCNDTITVTARDADGNEASVESTIQDNEPPVLAGCDDISMDTLPDELDAAVDFEVTATDDCKAAPSIACDAGSGDFFAIGSTTVSCEAQDACGNVSQCSFTVTVNAVVSEEPQPVFDDEEEPVSVDEPEEIGSEEADPDAEVDDDADACVDDVSDRDPFVSCSVDMAMLWPPNHKLVATGFTTEAVDSCETFGGDVAETVLTTATEVWSDEPEAPRASKGTGMHAPDAKDLDSGLRLRAERSGKGDGRVYLAISVAENDAGNEGWACCTVIVPHSQRHKAIERLEADAEDALAHCEEFGFAPDDFHQHGLSREIGPKQ